MRNPGKVVLGRHSHVLPPEVEDEIRLHIKYMEKCLYGLTTTDVQRLAYEINEKANIPHPFNKTKQMAGESWLQGFMKRHPDLSLRTPTATSMSRATGFNKVKVQEFFDVYKTLSEEHQYTLQIRLGHFHDPILRSRNLGQILGHFYSFATALNPIYE